jgi:hypothetical protein
MVVVKGCLNFSAKISVAMALSCERLEICIREGSSFRESANALGESQFDHRSRVSYCCHPLRKSVALALGLTLHRWMQEQCVGQVGSIPRLGFRSLCMQDSPLGVRFSQLLNLSS